MNEKVLLLFNNVAQYGKILTDVASLPTSAINKSLCELSPNQYTPKRKYSMATKKGGLYCQYPLVLGIITTFQYKYISRVLEVLLISA